MGTKGASGNPAADVPSSSVASLKSHLPEGVASVHRFFAPLLVDRDKRNKGGRGWGLGFLAPPAARERERHLSRSMVNARLSTPSSPLMR